MSKALRILIILVFVGLAGLIALLLNPDTTKIFKEAQRSLVNAKSVHVDFSFEAKGDLAATILNGATYGKNVGDLRGSIATDEDFSKFPTQSISTFTMEATSSSGPAHKLVGESRKKDGVHYLNLVDATALEGLPSTKVGHWLKTKRPLRSWVVPPSERDAVLTPLDAGGFAAFRKAFAEADTVTFPAPKSEKDEDGTEVWHYHVKLSPNVAAALLLRMRELRSGAPSSEDDQIVASLEVESWGEPEGDVRIGKKDKRIRAIGFTTTMPEGTGASITVLARFSSYNVPVTVTAPEPAEDLDQDATAADAGLKQAAPRDPIQVTSATSTPLIDLTVTNTLGDDDDNDDLVNSQEYFYGSDPWNPDTDGDGYGDGTEVAHGMNPVGAGTLFGFGLGQ